MSMSAFAQTWTAPTPQYSEPVSKQSYYLYNTGSGRFLTAGNDWVTHATLGVEGLEILVTDSVDADNVPGWTLFVLTPYKGSDNNQKENKYVFVDSEIGMFMDMGSQGRNFFNFIAQGDGTYRIQTTLVDGWGDLASPGVNATRFVGWDGALNEDGTMQNTYVRPLLDETLENVGIVWAFVAPEVYPAFVARKALYEVYLRAVDFPTVSTAAAKAVYDNPAATVAELEAAAAELDKAIKNTKYDSATPDNPVELTELIVNADCASSTGWTGAVQDGGAKPNSFAFQGSTKENTEAGIIVSSFLENWTDSQGALPDKKMYQVIKDVPMGKYRLEADAIATRQNDENLEVSGVYLFADGGIMTKTACHTGNGIPEHFAVEFVALADSITIGFMTEGTDANWVGVDNFKLYFMGKDDNAVLNMLNEKIADAEENYTFDSSVRYYGATLEAALSAAITNAKTLVGGAATDDELKAAIDEIDSLTAAVTAEVAAYTRLYTLFDSTIDEEMAKYDGEAFSDLLDELDGLASDWETAYDERSYSTADIEAAEAQLPEVIRAGIKEVLNGPDGPGTELTSLLINPSFDEGAKGWTNSAGTGDVAVNNSVKNAEFFNKLFNISQTIEGLPNGKYTVKVQGFYRTTTHDEGFTAWKDGTANVRLYLYGNDSEKQCQNLFDSAQPTIVYDEGPNEDGSKKFNSDNVNADGTYTPNSMVGAAAYFEKGLYENELTFVVTDGTIKVGLKVESDVISGNYWSLFDNFRLYYAGNDTDAYADEIAKLCGDAQSRLDQGLRVDEAINKLNDAVATGSEALDKTPDDCVAAINQLHEAITYADASIQLVSDALLDVEDVTYKQNEVSSSYEGLGAVMEEILACGSPEYAELGMNFTTNDAVVAACENLKTEWTKYVQYDHLATASEAAPADITPVLENPGFVDATTNENSSKGWEGATGTANYGAYEIYNKAFDMYQNIVGLAPGYYKVTVSGFYRFAGDNSGPGATARRDSIAAGHESEPILANIYAMTSADSTEWRSPMQSIFAGGATESVTGAGEANQKETLGVECWVPHTFEAAASYLTMGYYNNVNEVVFQVTENDKVARVGLIKEELSGRDWTLFDEFKLYYLGASAPTAIEGVTADKAAGLAVVNTQYFDVKGVQQPRATQGVNIVKETLSDGSVRISKVVIR